MSGNRNRTKSLGSPGLRDRSSEFGLEDCTVLQFWNELKIKSIPLPLT